MRCRVLYVNAYYLCLVMSPSDFNIAFVFGSSCTVIVLRESQYGIRSPLDDAQIYPLDDIWSLQCYQ
jgi:hypothetical protein